MTLYLTLYLAIGILVATICAIGGNKYSKQDWDNVSLQGLTGDQQRKLNYTLDVVLWPMTVLHHLLR